MDQDPYQSYQPYQSRGVPQGRPSDGRSFHPGAHPDSTYNRLRSQRMFPSDQNQNSQFVPSATTAYTAAPAPPPHRSPYEDEQDRRNGGQGLGYSQSMRTTSTVTPGVDNMGTVAAGGGISGIALGVAHSNERESGVEAMRGADRPGNAPFHAPAERAYNTQGSDTPYVPSGPDSYHSAAFRGPPAAAPAGQVTPGDGSPYLDPSDRSMQMGDYPSSQHLNPGRYEDLRYQGRAGAWGPGGDPGSINPEDIADDGDDGFIPDPKRRSVLSIGRNSSRDAITPAAGGAAAGGVMGTIGGFVGRQNNGQDNGGTYGPVNDQAMEDGGEKSEWLKRQTTGNKKMMWIVGLIIGVVIIAAIVGGVVGGILGGKDDDSSSGGSGKTAEEDESLNGDLSKDSSEIKDLMDNENLHKVFPGVDYTPWGTQYPLCLKYPPSQNNVTRDMAVLSQLTNNVRIYGTDCNQTEMVLHAIDKLELKDMKLWLGVWLDTNTTTNRRQLDQLYKVLDDTNDLSIYRGAIVGNEALFRAGQNIATAQTNLIKYMDEVRDKFKEKNIDMPIATSDLGDNWNQKLASKADIVMANVHPFFAGVPVEKAAGWTWTFWQEHNVILTKGTNKKNIISEVGWPSGGGRNCGTEAPCQNGQTGSKAGVDELNQFMEDWVCQSLKNGTEYFWFEAFDEPWKESFNEPKKGMEWEDKWGLMDPGRNLKPGLKIPDCDGETAD